MKQIQRCVAFYLVIMASLLLWTTAQALETFEKAGIISAVGKNMLKVTGQEYRIYSSTRLVSADRNRRKFSDFKRGDHVWFEGTVLDGKRYVLGIIYETPDPS